MDGGGLYFQGMVSVLKRPLSCRASEALNYKVVVYINEPHV